MQTRKKSDILTTWVLKLFSPKCEDQMLFFLRMSKRNMTISIFHKTGLYLFVVFLIIVNLLFNFFQSQKGMGPDFTFTCVNANILIKISYLHTNKYFLYVVRICM